MNNNTVLASKLGLFALVVFGFGYALVPLYDVFCELTGVNGKTGELSTQAVNQLVIDYDRTITVQFDANVNSHLPWTFKPLKKQMTVHPGEVSEAVFMVVNNSNATITGQAVPSVAPLQGSLFFNKTECFCFTQQTLAANEQREMVVRFVVATDLPKKISALTLSYTFFVTPSPKADVAMVVDAISSI